MLRVEAENSGEVSHPPKDRKRDAHNAKKLNPQWNTLNPYILDKNLAASPNQNCHVRSPD